MSEILFNKLDCTERRIGIGTESCDEERAEERHLSEDVGLLILFVESFLLCQTSNGVNDDLEERRREVNHGREEADPACTNVILCSMT
jgi:hypothetical protein